MTWIRFFVGAMKGWAILPALLGITLSAPVQGQTPGKVYRLAVLAQADRSFSIIRAVVLPELVKAGFIEGQNLVVDYRAGDPDTLPRLAREMAEKAPDAILSIATPATRAAQQASKTVPVVFFGGQDAVQEGFAQTLSRPGGNVTGVVILTASLDAKRLELLHEAVPSARRIAVLLHAKGLLRAESERNTRAAAANIGLDVLILEAAGPQDYPVAFATMKAGGADALVIGANASFFADQEMLITLAREARLPTVCEWAEMATQGCMIGYGPDRVKLYQIAAGKLVQVLRGVSPESLPVEQPSLFEFAVNLRTAHDLGLTLSPLFLARADEVIE